MRYLFWRIKWNVYNTFEIFLGSYLVNYCVLIFYFVFYHGKGLQRHKDRNWMLGNRKELNMKSWSVNLLPIYKIFIGFIINMKVLSWSCIAFFSFFFRFVFALFYAYKFKRPQVLKIATKEIYKNLKYKRYIKSK